MTIRWINKRKKIKLKNGVEEEKNKEQKINKKRERKECENAVCEKISLSSYTSQEGHRETIY